MLDFFCFRDIDEEIDQELWIVSELERKLSRGDILVSTSRDLRVERLLVDLSEIERVVGCVRDQSLKVDRSGERIRKREFGFGDSSVGDVDRERESS